jgi:hypothetical protein
MHTEWILSRICLRAFACRPAGIPVWADRLLECSAASRRLWRCGRGLWSGRLRLDWPRSIRPRGRSDTVSCNPLYSSRLSRSMSRPSRSRPSRSRPSRSRLSRRGSRPTRSRPSRITLPASRRHSRPRSCPAATLHCRALPFDCTWVPLGLEAVSWRRRFRTQDWMGLMDWCSASAIRRQRRRKAGWPASSRAAAVARPGAARRTEQLRN